MTLLAEGVPLTLLLDLVLGPHSEDLLSHETPGSAEHCGFERRA
jgi:hypothetical protein